MLETADVDDDFFTPSASTSLANIFQKPSQRDSKSDNPSLKYTPPKPVSNVTTKVEDSKTADCVFAAVFNAFEWYNNVHTPKGNVGFAIMRALKTDIHSIVIYDANKVTLSCTTVSTNLLLLKKDIYVSFYDNARKYWTVHGKDFEIDKMIDALKKLGVSVEQSTADVPLHPQNPVLETAKNSDSAEKGSDTDSSVNRKTKAAILSRMANMGQAILPPLPLHKDTSSSDDDAPIKLNIRHKNVKRNSQEVKEVIPDANMQITPLKPLHLANVPSTNIISSSIQSNVDVLMTEQRMNNSEIRMNMGRLSDKIDGILEKINSKNDNAQFPQNVYQKLINEYESKIALYEKIIKKNKLETMVQMKEDPTTSGEIEVLKEKFEDLKLSVAERDTLINSLLAEVDNLKSTLQLTEQKTSELQSINETLTERKKELEIQMQNAKENVSYEANVKQIMNDTYQGVSDLLEDDESYSGATIKKVVGSVIKKNTLRYLKTA